MPQDVHISRHPLVFHKLAHLRDRDTESKTFRLLVREIAQLLFYEATEDLKLEPLTVETPLGECSGQQIVEKIGLMPILPPGLGRAGGIHDIVPVAQVWPLGLCRDHQPLKPVTYYNKRPPQP